MYMNNVMKQKKNDLLKKKPKGAFPIYNNGKFLREKKKYLYYMDFLKAFVNK